MAENINFPYGLQPENKDCKWNPYAIAAAYATPLFVGDQVQMVAGGTVEKGAITAAALWIGVIVGFEGPNGGTSTHFPGTEAGWTALVTDGDQRYIIQEDSVGSTLTLADIGQNALVAAGAGGNTDNGLSSTMLDSSSIAVDATFPLIIVGFQDRIDNVAGDDYGNWIVVINTALLSGDKVGI